MTATALLVRATEAEAAAEQRAADLADEVAVQRRANRYVRELVAAFGQERRPGARQGDSVLEMLERAARGAEGLYLDRPELEITLRLEIGRAYYHCGEIDRARTHLERAFALAESHLAPNSNNRWMVTQELGEVLTEFGELDRAEQLLRTAVTQPPLEHPAGWNPSSAPQALAQLLVRKGAFAEAAKLAERVYDELLASHGEDSHQTLTVLSILVLAKNGLHDPSALPLAERAVTLAERHFGDRSKRAFTAKHNLSVVLTELGHGAARCRSSSSWSSLAPSTTARAQPRCSAQ